MDEGSEREESGRADVDAKTKQATPWAAQAAGVDEQNPAQQERQQQHGEAGQRERGHWVIPLVEEPFAKNPLAEKGGKELPAVLPRDVGIVRRGCPQNQRPQRQYF